MKIEQSQVRSNAMHMLSSPFIRNKGFVFEKNMHKQKVKKFYAKEVKKMQSSTHYVVENPLVQLIEKSVSRRKVRHFINAVDNAQMPHQNFFVEWFEQRVPQGGSISHGAHIYTEETLTHERKYDYKFNSEGDSYSSGLFNETDLRENIQKRSVTTIRFFCTINDGDEEVTMLDPLEATLIPNTNSNVGTAYPIFLLYFDLEKTTDEFDRVCKMINVKPSPGHPHERESDKTYLQWCPKQTAATHQLFDCLNDVYGYDRSAVMTGLYAERLVKLISIISLLNYDWKVENKEGVIVDKVKSVNTEAIKKDSYKKVTIDLPKKKEVLDFFKQKPRTRKFGTAEHVVRGHWRVYKKSGERVWIDEHHRGDKKHGTIHKDYVLTKQKNYLK